MWGLVSITEKSFWRLFLCLLSCKLTVTNNRCQHKSIFHICQLLSAPSLSHLQRHAYWKPLFLTITPPSLLKLKCKNADCPMRFLYIICRPPPPLTPAPLKHHSGVWQRVGDFWQVALISWLGKKLAWQWRTCVRFRTSLNLSDPLIWDAPTGKHSLGLKKAVSSAQTGIWSALKFFGLTCLK